MAKGKEIAVRNEATALDILDEHLDEVSSGFNPQPVRIEIMHKQGMFQFPGISPEKRLEGVVLASRMVRVFFPRMGLDADTDRLAEVTGGRPVCRSDNYTHGNLIDIETDDELFNIIRDKIAEGAGDCFRCPLNQWASVEILGRSGNGKACNELRRLLFWKPGMLVPVILSVPSSSIRNWDVYCSALTAAGLRHNHVVTEVSAEVKEQQGRKDRQYSILQFSKVGNVTEEMAEELLADVMFRGVKQSFIKSLVTVFLGQEITLEDYPTNGTQGGDEL